MFAFGWDSILCLANCYFAHNSLRFPALLLFFNASSRRPSHPVWSKFSSCPLSLANCYFAYDSSGFQPYVTMLHCVENCWMEFLRTTGGKLQVTLFQLV